MPGESLGQPVIPAGQAASGSFPGERNGSARGPIPGRMPALVGRRAARRLGQIKPGTLPLFVREESLNDLLVYSEIAPRVEVGGFLVGNWYAEQSVGEYLLVEHYLPARAVDSRFASLTFSHATWRQLREQMQEYPESIVLGWHHTHPGMGIFLSNHDQFIQEHFFGFHWQVAMVVDPCQGQLGVFQWQERKLVNNGMLVIPGKLKGGRGKIWQPLSHS